MASFLSGAAAPQSFWQGGGSLTEFIDTRADLQGTSLATSNSYSPPRHVLSRPHTLTTITVASARTSAPSKRRRRGRRQPDAGEGGGDDDDGGPGDGGFGGNGGWENDDEDGSWQIRIHNIWMWQAICVCGLMQAVHHLASEKCQAGHQQPKQMMAFAH